MLVRECPLISITAGCSNITITAVKQLQKAIVIQKEYVKLREEIKEKEKEIKKKDEEAAMLLREYFDTCGSEQLAQIDKQVRDNVAALLSGGTNFPLVKHVRDEEMNAEK